MATLEFIADIKNGWLVSPAHIVSFLKHCEGRQARILLSWGLKKRTLKQNSYYKGIIIPHFVAFMKEHGTTIKPEVADMLIKQWVGYTYDEKFPDGSVKPLPKSTTELDTKEMSAFTEEVIADLAQRFGLYIPPPNNGDIADHYRR